VADSIVVEKARKSASQAVSGGLQSLCWGSSAIGGVASAYFSGSLLETFTAQQVFMLTAIFPLAVSALSWVIQEETVKFGETAIESVKEQAVSLWGAVKQQSIWLPALFILLWKGTPSYDSAFFYYLTNEIKIGPEFLGRVRLGSSIASLLGVWLYQSKLKELPVSKVLLWSTIISVPLGFTPLLLVYHINRQLGIPDEIFAFGDEVIFTVLGQVAFMPTLVLAARMCPPGVEGALFATLMSVFNAGGLLSAETGALLTKWFDVTDTNFSRLGDLIVVCNLSTLLALPFFGVLSDLDADSETKSEDESLSQKDTIDV